MRRRYVYIDGEPIEVSNDYRQELPATVSHNVIPDIQPYQSMADGSMIQGRRQHREHLRRHGLREVGNDAMPKPADMRKTGAKEALVRSLQEAKAKHGSRKVELAISDAMNRAYELKRR